MRVGIIMPPLSPTGPVDRDRRRHGQHLGAALQNLVMVERVHPVEVDGVAGEGALTPASALDALDLAPGQWCYLDPEQLALLAPAAS